MADDIQRHRHSSLECRGGVADRNYSGEPLRPWRLSITCAKVLVDICIADPCDGGILEPLPATDGGPGSSPVEEPHQPPFGTFQAVSLVGEEGYNRPCRPVQYIRCLNETRV